MSKKLDRLYIRVDANFPDDEKYQALPSKLRDSAYLFFEALNGWSRDKKTDGHVPMVMAYAIGRKMDHPAPRVKTFLAALAAAAIHLVELRFEGTQNEEVFIPTYPKWQDTREEIEQHSQVRSEAGRRGGLASGRSRREANASGSPKQTPSKVEANASASAQANANQIVKQNEAETETETVVASYEATCPGGGGDNDPVKESGRNDVDRLCAAMVDSVEERGERRPRITAEWRKQARLMLDSDRRPLEEALDLIGWSSRDPFWSANVLSIPKFREQYPKLRLQRQRAPTGSPNGPVTPVPRHEIPPEDSALMRGWMSQAPGGVA